MMRNSVQRLSSLARYGDPVRFPVDDVAGATARYWYMLSNRRHLVVAHVPGLSLYPLVTSLVERVDDEPDWEMPRWAGGER